MEQLLVADLGMWYPLRNTANKMNKSLHSNARFRHWNKEQEKSSMLHKKAQGAISCSQFCKMGLFESAQRRILSLKMQPRPQIKTIATTPIMMAISCPVAPLQQQQSKLGDPRKHTTLPQLACTEGIASPIIIAVMMKRISSIKSKTWKVSIWNCFCRSPNTLTWTGCERSSRDQDIKLNNIEKKFGWLLTSPTD